MGVKSAEERLDVIRKLRVGDRGESAVIIVTIPAVFLCAVTHPVLGHGNDRVWCQSGRSILHAFDIGFDLSSRYLSVFSEGSVKTRPSWFGGQIGLGR